MRTDKIYYSVEGFPFKVETHNGENGVKYYACAFEQGFFKSISAYLNDIHNFTFTHCGIGFLNAKNYEEYKLLRHSRAYVVWIGILGRIGKGNYKNVGISNEWKIFGNFKTFYDKWYKEGYVIDKDLLSEGKKIYSKETCTFMPAILNNTIREMTKPKLHFSKLKNKYFFDINFGYHGFKVFSDNLDGIIHEYCLYRCVRLQTLLYEYSHTIRKEAAQKLEKFYDLNNYEKWLREQINKEQGGY